MSGDSTASIHQVLSVTNNRAFAKERELILTSLGFRVQSRDRWTIRHASLHGYDLVLICHTVNSIETMKIKERLRGCGSEAPVLRIYPVMNRSTLAKVDGMPAWALAAQFLVRWKPVETMRKVGLIPLLSTSVVTGRKFKGPVVEYLETVSAMAHAGR